MLYFNVEEWLQKAEEKLGRPFSAKAREILTDFGEWLNLAYADGFRDGKKAGKR